MRSHRRVFYVFGPGTEQALTEQALTEQALWRRSHRSQPVRCRHFSKTGMWTLVEAESADQFDQKHNHRNRHTNRRLAVDLLRGSRSGATLPICRKLRRPRQISCACRSDAEGTLSATHRGSSSPAEREGPAQHNTEGTSQTSLPDRVTSITVHFASLALTPSPKLPTLSDAHVRRSIVVRHLGRRYSNA